MYVGTRKEGDERKRNSLIIDNVTDSFKGEDLNREMQSKSVSVTSYERIICIMIFNITYLYTYWNGKTCYRSPDLNPIPGRSPTPSSRGAKKESSNARVGAHGRKVVN